MLMLVGEGPIEVETKVRTPHSNNRVRVREKKERGSLTKLQLGDSTGIGKEERINTS